MYNLYKDTCITLGALRGLKFVTFEEEDMLRIVAVKNFADIKRGQVGGLISNENSLSQYGNCWVDTHAVVLDSAKVRDNGRISGYAVIRERAMVSGNAIVNDHCVVGGTSIVRELAVLAGCVNVAGDSVIGGCCKKDGTYVIKNEICVQ